MGLPGRASTTASGDAFEALESEVLVAYGEYRPSMAFRVEPAVSPPNRNVSSSSSTSKETSVASSGPKKFASSLSLGAVSITAHRPIAFPNELNPPRGTASVRLPPSSHLRTDTNESACTSTASRVHCANRSERAPRPRALGDVTFFPPSVASVASGTLNP